MSTLSRDKESLWSQPSIHLADAVCLPAACATLHYRHYQIIEAYARPPDYYLLKLRSQPPPHVMAGYRMMPLRDIDICFSTRIMIYSRVGRRRFMS